MCVLDEFVFHLIQETPIELPPCAVYCTQCLRTVVRNKQGLPFEGHSAPPCLSSAVLISVSQFEYPVS